MGCSCTGFRSSPGSSSWPSTCSPTWRLPATLAAEARGALEGGPGGPGGQTGGQTGVGRHARRAAEVLGGRGTRLALLVASILAGLVIALLTVHLTGKWEPIG